MRIVNPAVTQALELRQPLRLNLGSGPEPEPGFFSLDRIDHAAVDVVADLEEPLSLLPDDCTEAVYSSHALEHVHRLPELVREVYRISAPDARVEILVPHFSNPFACSDPTHVRFFGLYTMYYFCATEKQPSVRKVPSFYSDARFTVDSVRIEFYRESYLDRSFGRVLEWFVNRGPRLQQFYERRLCGLFHAWQIRYVMRPDK